MSEINLKKNTLTGLIWKFFENFGTQFVNFIIQIVLARILLPEDYGLIALTAVFILIAQVFIQTGFSSALIQKKEVSQTEYSTVFFAGIILSFVLYGIIFISSPFISRFYESPLLNLVLKVQALTIIISAFSSVQNAIITRNLEFKKSFTYRLIAVIIQGAVGITMAIMGYGVWSIVVSSLVNTTLVTIAFWIIITWRPSFIFSVNAFKELFSFSSRILMFGLVNVLFNNIQSLIIGKQFNTTTLGYYNRGYQIPMLIMVNTDGAINAVMFSSLSKVQDDQEKFVTIYRRTIRSSVFLTFPIMMGLIAVAEPLTVFLLTDKWLESVPFMQLTALICMTWPFSIMFQALNAQQMSKASLRLNIISKLIAFAFLMASLQFGVYAFVFSVFLSSLIFVFIGFYVIQRVYKYTIITQIKDIIVALILSILMALIVYLVGQYVFNILIKLMIQLFVGVSFYMFMSYLFNRDTITYLIKSVMDIMQGRKISIDQK